MPKRNHSPEPGSAVADSLWHAWFGPEPHEVGSSVGAGFSGAPLVRVRPRHGTDWFVLKAFAPGTPRRRAEWVHSLVGHLAARGVAEVPLPRASRAGPTLVTDDHGTHWELVPFVAGVSADTPTSAQASAALEALARIHVAGATLPGHAVHRGPLPAWLRRREQAAALEAAPWSRRQREAAVNVGDATAADVAERWRRAAAMFASSGGPRAVSVIAHAAVDAASLQPVLRDVWSAHVLFAGEGVPRVAGVVDPHAAAVDTPATDLARLLGSWRRLDAASAADPVAAWPDAIAAYVAVRPTPAAEVSLVPFLHAAGIVCGLDNWFRWWLEERRSFADPAAALARIDRLLEDLPAALEWLAGRRPGRV